MTDNNEVPTELPHLPESLRAIKTIITTKQNIGFDLNDGEKGLLTELDFMESDLSIQTALKSYSATRSFIRVGPELDHCPVCGTKLK